MIYKEKSGTNKKLAGKRTVHTKKIKTNRENKQLAINYKNEKGEILHST